MKTSFYDINVDVGQNTLLFNSFSQAFMLMRTERFRQIYTEIGFVEQLLSEEERNALCKNGFLIDDDVDERALFLSCRQMERLRKRDYHIVINPTLDCNLGCWYCYESHKKGSRLSSDLIGHICKHIELKQKEDRLEKLIVSFFGGEPLLCTKEVVQIANFCKKFCHDNKIELQFDFTTNATIITETLFSALEDCTCTFQITLDGSKERHDKIRCFKANGRGTYDLIVDNIDKVLSRLPKSSVRIRINYDADTLSDIETLIQPISQFAGKNVSVSLHKVWQADAEKIELDMAFQFVLQLRRMGINAILQEFPLGHLICYADRINSCVINYNGDVFKCTAKDFRSEERCGKLLSSGVILWDVPKLQAHCFSSIANCCLNCKLLPCCSGFCSKNMMEHREEKKCLLDHRLSIDEIVLMYYYINKTKPNTTK